VTRRARALLGEPGGQRLVLALFAYLPLLLTAPGRLAADTKSYLYLDPGRLLASAPHLWDDQVGLGTITHQNIGYLWPMGPFFWLSDTVGLPDWVAQRLWMGSVLFLAGLGVQYLLRVLGWRGTGVLVAALAYALSPYVLHYVARMSAILLPWVGLPWLIALTVRSLRVGGWRYPALFALVATTVGGTNATSLLLVGLGPALWVVHAVAVEREVELRAAFGACVRIGALTLVTGLWWIAGLRTQGTYGLPILRFTETYEVVADAATAPELFRGLGHWFFYGGDKIGPWIEPSVRYTQSIWLLVLSFGLPCLALLAGGFLRFRHRAYFLALVVVGVLVGVGAHPYDDPSFLGGIFKEFTRTEAGLALRSTPRALPLAVLGTAVLFGGLVTAVARRWPSRELPAVALVGVLVLANQPSLFTGEFIGDNVSFPEDVPASWEEATADLDATGSATRVLEVPGSDFSTYRWGNTVDPVTPGLMDRPYVARELIPYGTPASADLLKALDRMFQEGTYDPDALVPLAQLLGVGDVVLRADLQYERYRTPRPVLTYHDLLTTPGLGAPTGYGPREPNVAGPEQPLLDEIELGIPAAVRAEQPAPVEVFPVVDAAPIVRAVTAERPLLVAGSADGLVDAAGMGLVDPDQLVLFSASFAAEPERLVTALDDGADLLVTDSNRRRASRWGTIRETEGYTERADEEPLVHDPTDNRLDVFPDADSDAQTVAVQRGAEISATDYGNSTTYTIDDRAFFALDGDVRTAWETGVFEHPVGERLVIDLPEPVTLDRLTLLQPLGGPNRWITRLAVRLAAASPDDPGGRPDPDTELVVDLDDTSRAEPGQTVAFPAQTVQRIELEVLATNIGRLAVYTGFSPVGFADVGIVPLDGPTAGDPVVVDEWIRLPEDLLAATAGSADERDLEHRLGILVTRLRSDPREPVRVDGEPRMRRLVTLPSERSFSLRGEARLAANVPDEVIDELLGHDGTVVTSSFRLPGDLRSRARAAFDADPTTAWRTSFASPAGNWLEVRHDEPVEVDRLALDVVVDGRHSVPTALRVLADGVEVGTVAVPDLAAAEGATTARVELDLPAFTASTVRIELAEVAPILTKDWHTGADVVMPVGIAEVEGLDVPVVPDRPVATPCRSDLVVLDGEPVPVRVSEVPGRPATDRAELALEGCDTVRLEAGTHEIETVAGAITGLDVDRLLFASDRGGDPLAGPWEVDLPAAPEVAVTAQGRDTATVELGDATAPYWLVLGQSQSPGWDAAEGLGASTLVNGYSNGWRVDPTDAPERPVALAFTPQRVVWFAIWASVLGLVLTIALALRGRRHGFEPAPPPSDLPHVVGLGPAGARASSAALLTPAVLVPAVLAAGAALLNLHTAVVPGAVLVAVVTGLAARGGRLRILPMVAASASLGAAALFVVAKQVDQRLPADFAWPQQFERVHVLGVLAVAFVIGEVVLSIVEARRAAREG
jgi:arabinofuranan 3-O-arabinosyltransferase